ncbi:MAG: 30S ribosomal protein S17 [Acidimicrobiales bacterium]
MSDQTTENVATEAPPAGDRPAATDRSLSRKTRDGLVVSTKMDKTAVVEVTRRSRHPQYNKTVQQRKKYYAHDEDNTLNVGDRVRIIETRPLSAKKRWRLLEILERAR